MNERVKDVMTSLVVMVYPDDPIERVAGRLRCNRISGAPVVEEGKVIGVISQVDIVRGLNASTLAREPAVVATDVMSRPVVTIGTEDSLVRAAQLLDRHGIKRLPVVDQGGYLLGIVSRDDLVRSMTRPSTEVAV